jgi:hypothetical protein
MMMYKNNDMTIDKPCGVSKAKSDGARAEQ